MWTSCSASRSRSRSSRPCATRRPRGVEGRKPCHPHRRARHLGGRPAQDGRHRLVPLAITEADLPDASADEFQAVISGSFLSEIASLSLGDSALSLALAENQIVVTCGDTVFINRRIEGNFPNYKQLLPDGYATRAKIDVDRLVSAVKRTSLLGSSDAPVRFDLNAASQTVQLSAAAQDVGSAQETIGCEIEGEDTEIAFNYSFVLSGLAAVATEKTYLEVQSSLKPGIFRADEPENYLYLVMPVRIV